MAGQVFLMGDNGMSPALSKLLRRTAYILGAVLVLAGITADLTGLSVGPGISTNQVLFVLMGLAVAGAGLLGRRFARVWRTVALVVFNVLIALLVIDLFALAAVKVIDSERFSIRKRKMEAVNNLDQFERSVASAYFPYVVWRAIPDTTVDRMTSDSCGFRVTPALENMPAGDTLKVFTFGGSAMWGDGVIDRETIPYHLQQILARRLNRPVSVRNFAQIAHVSTQELIELILQLREGHIPDLVVFYDGFNDAGAAFESGIAGAHFSLKPIKGRIEGDPLAMGELPLAAELFARTNTFLLLNSLGVLESLHPATPPTSYADLGMDTRELACAVVDTYLGNESVVERLSASYGFESIFVWQPHLWCGSKPMTGRERTCYEGGGGEAFLPGQDEDWKALIRASYAIWADSALKAENRYDFSGILNGVEDELYIDWAGVHLNPQGNRIVAESLAVVLIEGEYI
jgi:lysophospholipase L1-like esterase